MIAVLCQIRSHSHKNFSMQNCERRLTKGINHLDFNLKYCVNKLMGLLAKLRFYEFVNEFCKKFAAAVACVCVLCVISIDSNGVMCFV